jgi:hypothetical protein
MELTRLVQPITKKSDSAEVLTEVTIKNAVFSDVTPFSLVELTNREDRGQMCRNRKGPED